MDSSDRGGILGTLGVPNWSSFILLIILVLTGECFHEIIAGLALFFDSDKKSVVVFCVHTSRMELYNADSDNYCYA